MEQRADGRGKGQGVRNRDQGVGNSGREAGKWNKGKEQIEGAGTGIRKQGAGVKGAKSRSL